MNGITESESFRLHCSETMCSCNTSNKRVEARGSAHEVLDERLELLARLEHVLLLADQLDRLVVRRSAGRLVARGGGGRLGEEEADAESLAEVARAEAAAPDEEPVVLGVGVQLGRERVLLLHKSLTTRESLTEAHTQTLVGALEAD